MLHFLLYLRVSAQLKVIKTNALMRSTMYSNQRQTNVEQLKMTIKTI